MARRVHRWRRRVANLGAACTHLLFPPHCTHCGTDLGEDRDGPLLCGRCRLVLGPKEWPGCQRCGAPRDDNPLGCLDCTHSQLRFDRAIPLGSYQGDLRQAVLRMKRSSQEPLSAAIGRLLAIRREPFLRDVQPDLVVPVPMHWTRRLIRGVNSPEIVAEAIGRKMGIPVQRRALAYCRKIRPQKDLSPTERFKNVRGAFRVRRKINVEGLRILLVDDILTTGATCSEAARVLKKAGASMIAACVVARTLQPNST